jgi:hypothetical protein
MTETNGNAQDLSDAIGELEDSLRHAAAAAARIKAALPRFERMSAAFYELESIIEAGRKAAAAGPAASTATEAPSRPTLVVPDAPPARTPRTARPKLGALLDDGATPDIFKDPDPEAADVAPIAPIGANGDQLTSFRLEFESNPGPLDLRAVDDAISEHPAVQDVALLDYDGRRATLKVWITATASPADVQQALAERAGKIVSDGSQVSIVALEDVA